LYFDMTATIFWSGANAGGASLYPLGFTSIMNRMVGSFGVGCSVRQRSARCCDLDASSVPPT
jgi:hypothetical protein